jgi:hypothetical protein
MISNGSSTDITFIFLLLPDVKVELNTVFTLVSPHRIFITFFVLLPFPSAVPEAQIDLQCVEYYGVMMFIVNCSFGGTDVQQALAQSYMVTLRDAYTANDTTVLTDGTGYDFGTLFIRHKFQILCAW